MPSSRMQPSDRCVREAGDFAPMVRRAAQSPGGAVDLRAVAVAEHLESGLVVRLENARQKKPDRMLAKIAGHVAHAQAPPGRQRPIVCKRGRLRNVFEELAVSARGRDQSRV